MKIRKEKQLNYFIKKERRFTHIPLLLTPGLYEMVTCMDTLTSVETWNMIPHMQLPVKVKRGNLIQCIFEIF